MTTIASIRPDQPGSPLIPAATLARYPAATLPPAGHTAAELARLVQLLRAARADAITIGHGRHPASAAAAHAPAGMWDERAGTVLSIISWPATAASWLRPAQQLAASLLC